jgi:hypothetical protein
VCATHTGSLNGVTTFGLGPAVCHPSAEGLKKCPQAIRPGGGESSNSAANAAAMNLSHKRGTRWRVAEQRGKRGEREERRRGEAKTGERGREKAEGERCWRDTGTHRTMD